MSDTPTPTPTPDSTDHDAVAAAALAGQAPPIAVTDEDQSGEVDFFAFDLTETVYLPGSSTQYVVIKSLTEGEKKAYQNLVNREVTLKKGGDAQMKMAAGDERHHLLKNGIVDWHLLRRPVKGGRPDMSQPLQPVTFNARELGLFLDHANPVVVEHIEKALRKANPWLMAEMDLEDMIRERDNLNEMIAAKEKEEAGNGGSASS